MGLKNWLKGTPNVPLPVSWEWERGRRLGGGEFCKTYLGTREDGKLFVVKSTFLKCNGRNEMLSFSKLGKEISILYKVKSKYIVSYLGHGFSKQVEDMDKRETLDLFLEYNPRGTLMHLRAGVDHEGRTLSENLVATYTADVLRGLQYLHANYIVHGDIKGGHILMGKENLKLADFGTAKDMRDPGLGDDNIALSTYTAPEVESGQDPDYASDIFALGCTVIEMATGQRPVNNDSRENSSVRKKIPDHLSNELQNFLLKCLDESPEIRHTATELLGHVFIQNHFRSVQSILPGTLRQQYQGLRYVDPLVEADCLEAPPFEDNFPYVGYQERKRKSLIQMGGTVMGCAKRDAIDVENPSRAHVGGLVNAVNSLHLNHRAKDTDQTGKPCDSGVNVKTRTEKRRVNQMGNTTCGEARGKRKAKERDKAMDPEEEKETILQLYERLGVPPQAYEELLQEGGVLYQSNRTSARGGLLAKLCSTLNCQRLPRT